MFREYGANFVTIADTSREQLAQGSNHVARLPSDRKPTLDISQIGVGVVVHIVIKTT